MPVPTDPKKADEIFNSIAQLCDVMLRQVVSIRNTVLMLKSDATERLPLPGLPKDKEKK